MKYGEMEFTCILRNHISGEFYNVERLSSFNTLGNLNKINNTPELKENNNFGHDIKICLENEQILELQNIKTYLLLISSSLNKGAIYYFKLVITTDKSDFITNYTLTKEQKIELSNNDNNFSYGNTILKQTDNNNLFLITSSKNDNGDKVYVFRYENNNFVKIQDFHSANRNQHDKFGENIKLFEEIEEEETLNSDNSTTITVNKNLFLFISSTGELNQVSDSFSKGSLYVYLYIRK